MDSVDWVDSDYDILPVQRCGSYRIPCCHFVICKDRIFKINDYSIGARGKRFSKPIGSVAWDKQIRDWLSHAEPANVTALFNFLAKFGAKRTIMLP
jgi:hypothetical protein